MDVLLEEINRMNYLLNHKRGVVISEQESNIVYTKLFGDVDITKIKDSKSKIILKIKANKKGFTFIPEEGFRGECLFVGERMEFYPERFITYHKEHNPEKRKETFNIFSPPKFPIGVKEGNDIIVRELQIKFYQNNRNKRLKEGIYNIELGFYENLELIKDQNINPVPGGNLIIQSFELRDDIISKKSSIPNRPAPKQVTIKLDAKDPFKFNSVDFSDNVGQLINEFVEDFYFFKKQYPKSFQEYVKFIKDKKPILVKAYSSIDDDPNQVIDYVEGKNAVEGCGGKQKRFDYNKCLSQKRADKIAEILKSKIPELSGIFVGQGLGETDEFAPGKKWPEVKDKNLTAPNRRFVVGIPSKTFVVK